MSRNISPAPGGADWQHEADGPLGGYRTLAEYQQRRAHIFQSMESLRWFMRRNRAALVRLNALTAPTGTVLINVPAFDAAVAEIGQQRVAA